MLKANTHSLTLQIKFKSFYSMPNIKLWSFSKTKGQNFSRSNAWNCFIACIYYTKQLNPWLRTSVNGDGCYENTLSFSPASACIYILRLGGPVGDISDFLPARCNYQSWKSVRAQPRRTWADMQYRWGFRLGTSLNTSVSRGRHTHIYIYIYTSAVAVGIVKVSL